MKKSTFITSIAFAFIMLLSTNVNAQKFSGLDKSPMDAASFPSSYKESNKLIKVVYSRPQLKGRDLETLAPNGKVWRTGANEAAEITFIQGYEVRRWIWLKLEPILIYHSRRKRMDNYFKFRS